MTSIFYHFPQDNKNTAVVSLAYAPLIPSRRITAIDTENSLTSNTIDGSAMKNHLKGIYQSKFNLGSSSRREAESNDDFAAKHRLLVTFKNTIFLNNSHGQSFMGVEPQGGIIMADPTFHDMVFENCLFLRNNFYYPDQMVRIKEHAMKEIRSVFSSVL
jgi:hypothetical protein